VSAPPGMFVCVVGPSGAGKDTLLRFARETLTGAPGFRFPRRSVTRPASAHEDHARLSEDDYAQGLREGRFALAWRAHGLGYAIDDTVLTALTAGDLVVCNVSREAVAAARRNFPRIAIVLVTASESELARRLAARGRETSADIDERLARNRTLFDPAQADFVIDNSGPPASAREKLVSILRALRQRRPADAAQAPR
jgi:ribose 1,5-bisphosphokinase